MILRPIFTVMQIAPDQRQNGPVPFLSNIGGPIGFLQGELEWRLFDFCRIHQIVYKEINNIEVYLDKIDIEPLTNNKDDLENINKVRKMDYIVGQVHENERVTNFVDQMTVVGLWAIAEQFLGKIYKAFLSKKNEIPELNIQAPYRWDDFNREYNNLGIDLTTCENYQNADECRVLNNSIKHSPAVSSRLLQFAYFTKYSGQDIEKVPLEMQRYLNGVSDFLGSLIEKVNKSLA